VIFGNMNICHSGLQDNITDYQNWPVWSATVRTPVTVVCRITLQIIRT